MEKGSEGNEGRKALVAYALTENKGKTFWTRIGRAFKNRDGSLTVALEALPVSGRMQIRAEERRTSEPGEDLT